jgi:hypothetical protein
MHKALKHIVDAKLKEEEARTLAKAHSIKRSFDTLKRNHFTLRNDLKGELFKLRTEQAAFLSE